MPFCSWPGVARESRRSATSATTSKYEPPERRRDHDAERRRTDDAGVDLLGRADADRDDRLAERDDDDQPVALGEVRRHRASSPPGRTRPARPCRASARAPTARPAARRRRTTPRPAARRRRRCRAPAPSTDWRSAGSSRLATRNSAICASADEPVRARGEQQRGVVEHVGHAERRDQQARHRGEHDDPDGALLRVDDARQPGVADPAPPQHAEHEHALGEPLPRRRGRPSARCTA